MSIQQLEFRESACFYFYIIQSVLLEYFSLAKAWDDSTVSSCMSIFP